MNLLDRRDDLIAEYRRLLLNGFDQAPACFEDPQCATRLSEARIELDGSSFEREFDQFSEFVLAPAAAKTAEDIGSGKGRLGPPIMQALGAADGSYTLRIATFYTLAKDYQ